MLAGKALFHSDNTGDHEHITRWGGFAGYSSCVKACRGPPESCIGNCCEGVQPADYDRCGLADGLWWYRRVPDRRYVVPSGQEAGRLVLRILDGERVA